MKSLKVVNAMKFSHPCKHVLKNPLTNDKLQGDVLFTLYCYLVLGRSFLKLGTKLSNVTLLNGNKK